MLSILIFSLSAPHATFADTTPGNPYGNSPVPPEAGLESVSTPDHIIGTGTPESCTAEAFIQAVAKGGKIIFNGGTKPFTITLDRPAKLFNNGNPDVVIDGGGLVTLSGGGKTRILYMNTCDPNQVWTTNHAQNQDHPRLTVQNLTFANGNASSETEYDGGGAIWVRGGRFKVVNCIFINNVCANKGPDVGGGALRVFDQYEDLPVYVVNSTFGGKAGLGNVGSNGGALSSIGVSWTIINSVFSFNQAIGDGGNPSKPGTSGGGSGGAIYNDGNQMTLSISGSRIENNTVNAYGSGIFFVTNDHTGDIKLENTTLENNNGGSWYPVIPGVSMHADTKLTVTNTPSISTPQLAATPSLTTLLINGKETTLEAYNIDNANYYKLRDLAMILNGTDGQFEVTWDEPSQSIILTPGKAYTPTGGEGMRGGLSNPKPFQKHDCPLILKGTPVTLTACRTDDTNYFKIRDVAELLHLPVLWNPSTKIIELNTTVH